MFHLIAERKIEEALARGELANLPGEGRPLELDDDAPGEIRQLEDFIHQDGADAEARSKAVRKLALPRTRVENRYYEKAVAKLGR